MTYEIATVLCGGPGAQLPLNPGDQVRVVDNRANEFSPCEAYQKLLLDSPADVIIYSHDDVTVHDPDWLTRVMQRFYIPQCVAVGLGGATGLGNRDLYRKPFNIWNMARRGYASNQDDAETHGARFTGTRRCAVIEQFLMAIRADWLRSRQTLRPRPIGGAHANSSGVPSFNDGVMQYDLGWPVSRLTHHGLDMWLACEAARDGKEIWQVGASCLHSGGGSSTTDSYAKAPWLMGGSMASDHEIPHRWIFDSYSDVLPLEVPWSQ